MSKKQQKQKKTETAFQLHVYPKVPRGGDLSTHRPNLRPMLYMPPPTKNVG